MMNLSEAFNFAVKKIVEQGGQCLDKNDLECAYGSATKHCAVGWLLDHKNKDLMEYEGDVYDICNEFDWGIPSIIFEDRVAFAKLQRFHDAFKVKEREEVFNELKSIRPEVDYSGEHWETWINMGE